MVVVAAAVLLTRVHGVSQLLLLLLLLLLPLGGGRCSSGGGGGGWRGDVLPQQVAQLSRLARTRGPAALGLALGHAPGLALREVAVAGVLGQLVEERLRIGAERVQLQSRADSVAPKPSGSESP